MRTADEVFLVLDIKKTKTPRLNYFGKCKGTLHYFYFFIMSLAIKIITSIVVIITVFATKEDVIVVGFSLN